MLLCVELNHLGIIGLDFQSIGVPGLVRRLEERKEVPGLPLSQNELESGFAQLRLAGEVWDFDFKRTVSGRDGRSNMDGHRRAVRDAEEIKCPWRQIINVNLKLLAFGD
jgi:hypothetical protein